MAPNVKKSDEPTKDYEVLSNLRHNGKSYSKGKSITLTDTEASLLLAAKVVALAAPTEGKK